MFLNKSNTAKAYIKGSKQCPKLNGIVTFKEAKNGVLLTAKINGLPQVKGIANFQFICSSYILS